MARSTYKIIELIGTSYTSWEDAARTAVEKAAETIRDLRIAEIIRLDVVVSQAAATIYRARVKVSFKYYR